MNIGKSINIELHNNVRKISTHNLRDGLLDLIDGNVSESIHNRVWWDNYSTVTRQIHNNLLGQTQRQIIYGYR